MKKHCDCNIPKIIYLFFICVILLTACVFIFLAVYSNIENLIKTSDSNENIHVYNKEDFLMNTLVTQIVYSNDDETGQNAVNEATNSLISLENKTSMFISNSDISKLNDSAGKNTEKTYIKIDDIIFDLLKESKRLSLTTDGIFDITIGSVTSLWNINSKNPKMPSDARIQKAREQVDINNLLLDGKNKSAALLGELTKIDLGGIAKGYGCDIVMDIYKKSGLQGGLISIGGNVAAFGTKDDGGLFRIGIRDPFSTNINDYMGVLTTTNRIISTSAAYERNATIDGEFFHHIFDPRTGRPAESDIESITVISDSGIYGDFLSTYLYIAGIQEVHKYLNEKDADIICIDKNKNILISDNLKGSFELIE